MTAELRTTYLGLALRSPIVASPSPFSTAARTSMPVAISEIRSSPTVTEARRTRWMTHFMEAILPAVENASLPHASS